MNELLTSLRLYVVTVLTCCVGYPAVLLGFAALVAPEKSQGSLIRAADGTIVGSHLIAQAFTQDKYFWPRPSACDYKADATGGSNLSPANPDIAKRAEEILARYKLGSGQLLPADLVTASGSGLDPHVTRSAALVQAPRVALARGLTVAEVEGLIVRHVDSGRAVPFGGEPLVNVLELNLALDALTQDKD
jgi:K+-transporting ATPase ATPase C chain